MEQNQSGKTRRKKRSGRRETKENIILRRFTRLAEYRKAQPPKLENIRYRVMRSLKKCIRLLSTEKRLPLSGLLHLPASNASSMFWKSEFEEYIWTHAELIFKFAEWTEGRPAQHRAIGALYDL